MASKTLAGQLSFDNGQCPAAGQYTVVLHIAQPIYAPDGLYNYVTMAPAVTQPGEIATLYIQLFQ